MGLQQQHIPILDLSTEIDSLWDELNAAIQRVLRSGHFIMGPDVEAFEQEIAQVLGVKHAVACNSGTDALILGLRALGITDGAEVITTPFSFFATAEGISIIGAKPVFVDIDSKTFNIDPDQIERAITERTKAIIPVHLYGQSCELEQVSAIAERHDLKILEDVAQSFGGNYKGRMLGTIGHAGAFSFFPSKNLGAYGDAGLFSTDDDEVAEMVRKLRTHGSRKKYANEIVGYNSRLDTLQAAILRVKLPHVAGWNEARREAAHYYNHLLADVRDVTVPYEMPEAYHVYHQYTVRIGGGMRDMVRQHMASQGIDTMVYYPTPIHQLPIYKAEEWSMPASEAAAGEVLSLPIWPQITKDIQTRVVEVLCEGINIAK